MEDLGGRVEMPGANEVADDDGVGAGVGIGSFLDHLGEGRDGSGVGAGIGVEAHDEVV